MSEAWVIIVAAGEGKRLGLSKSDVLLCGKTLLERCLDTFSEHKKISGIVLVTREGKAQNPVLEKYSKLKVIAKGGSRRQDSVFSGFQKVNPESADLVLIHDVARPLVSPDLIDRVIHATQKFGASIPVVPVTDTLKKIQNDRVLHTVDRTEICRVQTPQGFKYALLKQALDSDLASTRIYTDEASLLEEMGQDVFVVPGDPRNIKITYPEDVLLAEALFAN